MIELEDVMQTFMKFGAQANIYRVFENPNEEGFDNLLAGIEAVPDIQKGCPTKERVCLRGFEQYRRSQPALPAKKDSQPTVSISEMA